MTYTRIIVSLGLSVVVAGGVADAAPSPQKVMLKCRAAIGKVGAATVKSRLKQLDACHTKRDRGKSAGDCNAIDPASLAAKLGKVFATKCRTASGVLANYTGDPAGTVAATIATELADSARTLQGLPDLAGDKQKIKCHAAIGKGRSGVVSGVVALSVRCQAGVDRQRSDPGGIAAECILTSEISNTRARSALQRACGTLTGADVGSCGTLPECVIASATTTGQHIAEAFYGGGGAPRCGDGVAQPPEQCDDGNTIDGDACTNECRNPVCGDGVVAAGVEECDDRNEFDTDDCVHCQLARCGDGALRDGVEECDDGNDTAGDGCTGCRRDPLTCGPNGIAVVTALDFVPAAVPGVRGVQFAIGYPVPKSSLPGSTPIDLIDLVENLFDPDGSRGSLLVANDRDTNSDGQDDRLDVLYTATENLPAYPDALVRVLFSCQPGAMFVPQDFGCQVREAVDEIGNVINGIGCAVTGVEAR